MNHFAVFALMALTTLSSVAVAADKLIIISPHRKSLQDEFLPAFKKWYQAKHKTSILVEWLDQGGTSDDVRFVRAKFAKNSKSSGIDVFWGGGTTTFLELESSGFLAPFELPAHLRKQVPQTAAGVPLYNKSKSWYASAMSSFGIFYNKKLLKFDKLPEPKTWRDLADPKFQGHITLTDPRRSGSAAAMNTIVMQGLGWDEGWKLLTMIGGNNRKYTHSSSDPIKAVVAGDAAASMAIDFYANAKIGDLGKDNLGFVLPAGQTVLDPDPVAILKGAPNRKAAERFVTFLLGADAQKLLVLPKGVKGGPRFAALGRMAINTKTYAQTKGKRTNEFNPFEQKAFLKLDLKKSSKLRRIFNDLIGATLIDTHKDLRRAWKAIVKRGMKSEEINRLGRPPVSEAEALKLAQRWDDDVFRNQTINKWVKFARGKYRGLASH